MRAAQQAIIVILTVAVLAAAVAIQSAYWTECLDKHSFGYCFVLHR